MVMREHDGYKNMYSLKKDEKTFTLITLSIRDMRKSENKVNQERRRLKLAKIGINGIRSRDETRKEGGEKKCMGKYRNIIFMQKGVRLRMIIFLTCL
jgi:hypothetical protein